MTPGKKRNKMKEWISNFFPPKREVYHTPDGPQLPAGSSYTTTHYEINNSFHVSGTGNVVTRQDGQGDRNLVSQIMNLLSQNIIRGAAHDDSARDPPPRCHPDTRVKLIARITAWFNGQAQEESLLWITGPAGIGKSAVIQTFAEYLARNLVLGASVFISRPNRRNDPHRIFVTIAYQLSIRIEAYRNFITERLSVDPELPSRGMAAQFAAFIIEPFVEKKIGAGGNRWGILLDGLDELDGEDAQCEIIQFVLAFAHEHRDAPLVWIIASRPEPHISNTFTDDAYRSYRSEYIPIDSTEACEDVERFLRSKFEATRKKYRQSVPSDWPSGTDFLKLIAAASGLFVYAEVTMEFIRDPAHSDPAARLEILLSVIDRSNVIPTKDNPFIHLDALYKEILSSIPLTHWPSTKRLLSYTIHADHIHANQYGFYNLRQSLQTLRGMAILLGLLPHVVYTCLLKCHSTLGVPDWKIAHKSGLVFHHASFADFLKDPTRSGDYHVGEAKDVRADMLVHVFDILNRCSGSTETVESAWNQYCSKWDNKTPLKAIAKFHAKFFRDFVSCLTTLVLFYSLGGDPVLHTQLCRVHMIKLCYSFDADDLPHFVNTLIDHKNDINDTELFRRVPLKSLKFANLDWEKMSPACGYYGRRHKFVLGDWVLDRPRSSTELKTFVSELEHLQERLPDLDVTIFGAVREGRVAGFRHVLKSGEPVEYQDFKYYIVPYPE